MPRKREEIFQGRLLRSAVVFANNLGSRLSKEENGDFVIAIRLPWKQQPSVSVLSCRLPNPEPISAEEWVAIMSAVESPRQQAIISLLQQQGCDFWADEIKKLLENSGFRMSHETFDRELREIKKTLLKKNLGYGFVEILTTTRWRYNFRRSVF